MCVERAVGGEEALRTGLAEAEVEVLPQMVVAGQAGKPGAGGRGCGDCRGREELEDVEHHLVGEVLERVFPCGDREGKPPRHYPSNKNNNASRVFTLWFCGPVPRSWEVGGGCGWWVGQNGLESVVLLKNG